MVDTAWSPASLCRMFFFQQQYTQTSHLECHRLGAKTVAWRAIAVRGVEERDAAGDGQVEHLLQLGVHALIVAPQELVPPGPALLLVQTYLKAHLSTYRPSSLTRNGEIRRRTRCPGPLAAL